MNHLKTFMMLAALTALFGVVGLAIGGTTGMVVALVFAALTNAVAYWNADKLALRAHGAHQVDAGSAPELVALVETLAALAGLPPPRVFVIDQPQPNAFATGRNPDNAAVAVTTGLLDLLKEEELAGVIAHELAHIKSYDTLSMTVAATIAGAMSTLVNFGMMFGSNRNRPHFVVSLLMMIVAPLAAAVIQMAISRSREYEADRVGAEISGNPLSLASALEKISGDVARIPNESAEMQPATAPLFIINPLSGRAMDGLFSTHPRTENRIEALVALAQSMGVTDSRPLHNETGRLGSSASKHNRRGPWG